jgi:hypothetical protein
LWLQEYPRASTGFHNFFFYGFDSQVFAVRHQLAGVLKILLRLDQRETIA